VVETVAGEIGAVIPFEIRPVVSKVVPVAIVAVPGGVVVVSIPGVFRLTHFGSGIVATAISGLIIYGLLIFRLIVYGSGSGVDGSGCDVHPGAGNAKAYMGVYIDLRIAFGSDEASGYDCGENKYLFTHPHN
jgi:hypothetical protein